jgi:preprotein translocase subunit SecE
MNEQAQTAGPTALDTAKIVLAIATLLGGLVAYYWYADLPTAARILMVLAGVAGGLLLLFWSAQGQMIWQFIQGSRVELRKMVWPTRQETWQTTLIVFAFVLLMGIFFWLVDMLLAWATKLLTGQGG